MLAAMLLGALSGTSFMDVEIAPKLGASEREWGPPPPVAPMTLSPLPHQPALAHLIFPLVGPCRWNDDYGENRKTFLHTGIDIKAPKMTPIVAPISGTLGLKRMTFWIYADDGWAVLGTHLNDDFPGLHDHSADRDLMFSPDLYPGCHVDAGQFIGYVGESGDATAPHLHFELYCPGEGLARDRIRDPTASLHAAKVLTEPVPSLPFPERRPEEGQIRVQGCLRRVNSTSGYVTLVVTAKQSPSGKVTIMTKPQHLRVRLSNSAVDKLGGWAAIEGAADTQSVNVYLPNSDRLDDAFVQSASFSE